MSARMNMHPSDYQPAHKLFNITLIDKNDEFAKKIVRQTSTEDVKVYRLEPTIDPSELNNDKRLVDAACALAQEYRSRAIFLMSRNGEDMVFTVDSRAGDISMKQVIQSRGYSPLKKAREVGTSAHKEPDGRN